MRRILTHARAHSESANDAGVELKAVNGVSSFFAAKRRSVSARWNPAATRVSAHSLTHRCPLGSR